MSADSTGLQRVALITGATGSIGQAIARRLGTAGFQLILAGRRSDALSQLCEEIGSQLNSPPVPLAVELTDYDALARAVENVHGQLGRIDVLVNNAGGWSGSHFGPFLEKTGKELAAEIDDNLLSAVFACRTVLPMMVNQRYGRVINISSVAGIIALEGHSAYSAAKAGHTGLTRQLAVEFAGLGITNNCVAPGAVLTPRAQILVNDRDQGIMPMIEMTPTGRLTSPEEVADLVGFLASDQAAHINGQTIAIDGGMTVV